MNPEIPVSRQCELLGLARSTFYYKPVGEDEVCFVKGKYPEKSSQSSLEPAGTFA
jgi:hypothetical protein